MFVHSWGRGRKRLLADRRRFADRVVTALDELRYTLATDVGEVSASPAQVRVWWAQADADEAARHGDPGELADFLSAAYWQSLTERRISVTTIEPVRVELVVHPSIARGRFVVEPVEAPAAAAPAPASIPAQRAPASSPPPPAIGFGGPAVDPSAPTIVDAQPTVRESVIPATVQELIFAPLALDVGYPRGSDRGPRRHVATTPTLEVGRGPRCDIRIEVPTVSQLHGRIAWDVASRGWQVHDAGSLNGIVLNGVEVGDPAPLGDGDVISLGRGADAPTLTVRLPGLDAR